MFGMYVLVFSRVEKPIEIIDRKAFKNILFTFSSDLT